MLGPTDRWSIQFINTILLQITRIHETVRKYTMKRLILVVALCTLPLSSLAEKGQSIMFGDQDPIHAETMASDPAREKADYCNKLRKEIDELKGKPQRRNMAIQRYELDCQQR
jgi:hypothetical protein